MNNQSYFGIGLMSGTSLDGIDLCYLKFNVSDRYDFEILKAKTYPYNNNWKSKLVKAFTTDKQSLHKLDLEYGNYLGTIINAFTAENNIENLGFIASHGHTVFHKPKQGVTLQIGDGQSIADATNHIVVCDFRTQDVNMGGQGAPLVPIGDKLLFANYDYCINLGGFANISFDKEGQRIAFDICPVNIVMNHYTNKIGLPYDDKGQLAKSGSIDQTLLNRLNGLPFYKMNPPKSLGLEWVIDIVFPLIDTSQLEIKDILRTFVEHIAIQISSLIVKDSNTLITGGGAFNDFLIERIEFYSNQKIELVSKELIDFKEALIFAFLGLLKLRGENNVLSSVTGANKDHSSGKIYYPKV
ncbi:anhydro-N-acetylmuramic acid kinase [Aureibaculum sp. 2210JD6-5]|uniref:anhydro-N-acetylmuramic acid kinase n=1 Tax=Aureibaculum sp. 2210JD6-5 TaxID=3103957 RepID=UPI002AADC698|nr:anhydro-N-acetylmuramic acid kinase [Aureibaculum sp. 2210JD6-5]MDY7396065.1 anhydro-N-acetylmuramic acid kinase [Aureibaculum sp. 2210JD6-5]